MCPDTHTLRTAHTPWFGGNRRHTLFTGYEPKCNGSQTFTDEKRSSNADSSRRKYLKKYDEQCNLAQSTPSGRFTKVKERGAVDMRKRKQEQQKNIGNVLRKKPEQTTNEHERNMSRYNKQKKHERETTSPRTRSKLTRPVRHLQSEQWMLESCETKQIMMGSKQATPGDETTKLVQAKLPQDGTSEEE